MNEFSTFSDKKVMILAEKRGISVILGRKSVD